MKRSDQISSTGQVARRLFGAGFVPTERSLNSLPPRRPDPAPPNVVGRKARPDVEEEQAAEARQGSECDEGSSLELLPDPQISELSSAASPADLRSQEADRD